MKYVFELSINHNLYKGAYSGLCCGNVYRDKGENDAVSDRYDLGDKIYPIIHGHSYIVEIHTDIDKLDPRYEKYFDEYQGATILTDDNPLAKVFPGKLIIWKENPTAEVMAKKWYDYFSKEDRHITGVSVEETAKNSVFYSNNGYEISTHIELPISREEQDGLIRGYNFSFTFVVHATKLNKEGMVIDFKAFKKAIHEVMDQYDHSIILTGNIKDSPAEKLLNLYRRNFDENKIDTNRTRLFNWNDTPTDFKMSGYFAQEIYNKLTSKLPKDSNLKDISISCIVNKGIKPDRYNIIARSPKNKIFYKQYFDTFHLCTRSVTYSKETYESSPLINSILDKGCPPEENNELVYTNL